jgi:hypothetical protein
MAIHTLAHFCGTAEAIGVVGFEIPLAVSRSGVHFVSANWSLAWNASARGWCCAIAGFGFSTSTVRANLTLSIEDLTNGTVYASTQHTFVSLISYGKTTKSSGSVQLTLRLRTAFLASHSYVIASYATADVTAGPMAYGGRSGHIGASFDFAGSDGGILNWVKVG